MSGDQYANLIYLGLLLAALAGWGFFQMRANLGKTVQYIAVWGLLFVAVMAGYGLWQDLKHQVVPMQEIHASGQIALPRDASGHYHATLEVNGVPVEFVVDTGATTVVLTQDDARRAGIATGDLAFFGQASTANGTVAIAPIRLESLALGPMVATDVPATVTGGEMDISLLGMTYLERFAKIEIAGGQLLLTP